MITGFHYCGGVALDEEISVIIKRWEGGVQIERRITAKAPTAGVVAVFYTKRKPQDWSPRDKIPYQFHSIAKFTSSDRLFVKNGDFTFEAVVLEEGHVGIADKQP